MSVKHSCWRRELQCRNYRRIWLWETCLLKEATEFSVWIVLIEKENIFCLWYTVIKIKFLLTCLCIFIVQGFCQWNIILQTVPRFYFIVRKTFLASLKHRLIASSYSTSPSGGYLSAWRFTDRLWFSALQNVSNRKIRYYFSHSSASAWVGTSVWRQSVTVRINLGSQQRCLEVDIRHSFTAASYIHTTGNDFCSSVNILLTTCVGNVSHTYTIIHFT